MMKQTNKLTKNN